jgi:D-tyrosyl-tRNA(Tyr) deacylase
MLAVLQRVKEATVAAEGSPLGSIGRGLVVLLCAVKGDAAPDVDYLVRKIYQLRVFGDERGKMNRSVAEAGGNILVVSQFTLAASVRKGNRPSFENAESPERARELCDEVVRRLRETGLSVFTGIFGAMMDVSLVNDGPVTIIIDSREGKAPDCALDGQA